MPRMMASNTTSSSSARHRPPPLFCIPEDGCSDDETGIGPVAWIAILRDGCLLVDIGEERVPEEVREIAGFLTSLVHTPMVGWNEYTTRGAAAQWKGLRYSEENAERSWTFTCVYNMQKFSPSDAEAFLQEIVDWTATVRQADAAWLDGGHHACQSLFAPLLQDRLQGLANPSTEPPITILEDDGEEDEQESEEKHGDDENHVPLTFNRNSATTRAPPFDPPKILNVAKVDGTEKPAEEHDTKLAQGSEHDPTVSKRTEVHVHTSDGSIAMDEKATLCDVSLESGEVLHVSAEIDDLWDTTLADIPQEKRTPPASIQPDCASPKKHSLPPSPQAPHRSPPRTPKSSSPVKSPTRKQSSPRSKRSPIRRKETVEEMVERLARKQAEMEKASKRPGALTVGGNDKEVPKTREPTGHEKPSDDSESSTTSATVEEDEESDGGDGRSKNTVSKEKSKSSNGKTCCWISSPLSQSKPGLLL